MTVNRTTINPDMNNRNWNNIQYNLDNNFQHELNDIRNDINNIRNNMNNIIPNNNFIPNDINYVPRSPYAINLKYIAFRNGCVVGFLTAFAVSLLFTVLLNSGR